MNDRVTDATLNQIGRRLRDGLNDDGLRAWYATDVGALLREVLVQRRIIADLEARVDNLADQLAMMPDPPRPRGRPRKILLT